MSRVSAALIFGALMSSVQVAAAPAFTFTTANPGTYAASYVTTVANALGSGGTGAGAYTMTAVDSSGNGTIDARVVNGNASGLYSAPWDTANHQITTDYFATGNDAFNLTFNSAQKYLGFLIGSVGSTQWGLDTISFYTGTTLIGQITGADITSNTSGSQTAANSFYVNVNFASAYSFNKVVFSNNSPSLEFANVVASTQNVVEPGMLGLFGLGVVGLGLMRRPRTTARVHA